MNGLVSEVLDVLHSRGFLSKEDIVSTWGLSDARYDELKRALAKDHRVRSGPKRVGGLRLATPKTHTPLHDDSALIEVTGEQWERDAIARLADLLQHKELEDLLAELAATVRAARKSKTGADRRGNKTELAQALLLKHGGLDLFADPEVRSLVASKCGITSPGRWHAGKQAAVSFVHAACFPPELAGIPAPDTPEDYEYLEGRIDIKPLQDFQQEVKAQVLRALHTYGGRAIVTLPTGAGKTRVAVESIREWLTERHNHGAEDQFQTVLWLAHSSELCEQAYSEFKQVWQASAAVCPLLLFRFWGAFTQDLDDHREPLSDMVKQPTVLISTPQRIVSLLEAEESADSGIRNAVLADLLVTTSLIVVDEAHRAAAPSYVRILERFQEARAALAVVGLTATPFRREYLSDPMAGTLELVEVFQNLIEARRLLGEDPREVLIRRGILARPCFKEIKTSIKLEAPPVADPSHLSDEDILRTDYALGIRADRPQRRMAVFEHILPLCRDPHNAVLYFGPSILDAECMALLMRQERVPAAVVSGHTRDATRRKIIGDFKSGRVRVLCNCEVLTSGFDAPRVTHVVVARPTVSTVLYEQMIGRGLRGPVFGGTEECVIIDCEDNYQSERPVLGYKAFRHMYRTPGSESERTAA